MEVGSGAWARNLDDVTGTIRGRLTLEGAVLNERARDLRGEATKLARQRAFLREERRRVRLDEEALRQDRCEFDLLKRDDWLPEHYLPGPDIRRMKLNVGGQVFEVSELVLKRDPGSLLAALCGDTCPLKADAEGVVYVDRDWWVFRYVLKFLRDGLLPKERALLADLYQEAGYWRCHALKRAIEESHLRLYRAEHEVDAKGELITKTQQGKGGWWSRAPTWLDSSSGGAKLSKEEQDVLAAHKKKKEEKGKEEDWWMGKVYKGRKFAPDALGDAKAKEEKAEPSPATAATWSYSSNNVASSSIW